jgi:hypothetical protein
VVWHGFRAEKRAERASCHKLAQRLTTLRYPRLKNAPANATVCLSHFFGAKKAQKKGVTV